MLFASDFHGCEVVWRKFLNSAKIFKCDWLVMGGDLTGKVLTPIIKQPDGTYKADFLDKTEVIQAGQSGGLSERKSRNIATYHMSATRNSLRTATGLTGRD